MLSSLGGLFEDCHQFFLNGLVAGNDMPLVENVIAAFTIGHEAAGLTYHDQPRRHVPRLKIALPIAVEPPRRDPGEIERCRAEAAQTGNLFLHGPCFLPGQSDVATAVMRHAAGDDSVCQALSGRDPDALLIEECAFAPLSNKHLLVCRIVNQASHHRAFTLECNRDGELRNAMEEIGGAVERVHDPGVRLVGTLATATFFA